MIPPDRTEPAPVADDATPRADRLRRAAFLAAAFGLWLWSTLAHGFGTELAHDYFEWAKTPGNVDAVGGAQGVRAAETLLLAAFVVLAAVGAWRTVRRYHGAGATALREHLLAWAIWGTFVHLLWKSYVIFASEFVHFGQYALVAGLLYVGLGRGGRTVAAFLIATVLGVLDEGWQHWGIALHIDGIRWHSFEWSDTLLNAAGACGGVLFLAAPATDERAAEAPRKLLAFSVAGLAAVLLPVLLLSRVAWAKFFGAYTYHPTWSEYDIGKAAHFMTPIDGIPLFLATVLFLGQLVAGARPAATRGVALALLVLGTLAVERPSRLAGRPIHEDVPTALARRVEPRRIVVDGALDEPEWAGAPRVGPFVRNEPDDARGPLAATTARFLWDERALYVAFEMEDRDVWARKTVRDDPRLPGDEVVEVFVDPDGDEVTYYEFEANPAGVVYDLFNYVPETPSDFDPRAAFVGLADWDARDVECAVKVDGTLDPVDDFAPSGALDADRGWTVEIAIPWRAFRTTTTPSDVTRGRLPPAPGERWRVGLFRIERPRASPGDGKLLSRNEAEPLAQYQAWSPTFRASFHRPERFGVVEFAEK